jgi:exodeoxyribonuclease VII large subunit
LRLLGGRLGQAMHRRLVREREALVRARRGLERQSPAQAIALWRQGLLGLRGRLLAAGQAAVGRERQRLYGAAATLDALSPLKVMGRGYAVAYRVDTGALVARAEDAAVGMGLLLRWASPQSRSLAECGEAEATVTAVRPKPS